MAQVYGPCVTAAEKEAQRHNTGQGQHQDSPKGARRLSKHCSQSRWDAVVNPALTHQLCSAFAIPFTACGQCTDIQASPNTQGSRFKSQVLNSRN